MPHLRSWFPEVDHLFCLLRILEWRGGSFGPGLLNYLLVNEPKQFGGSEISLCCEKLGLRVSDEVGHLEYNAGSTCLYKDNFGKFKSIHFHENYFLIYNTDGTEINCARDQWISAPGGRFWDIVPNRPLSLEIEVFQAQFNLINAKPTKRSTSEECSESSATDIRESELIYDPCIKQRLLERRSAEVLEVLKYAPAIDISLLMRCHSILGEGLIKGHGSFRILPLMRGGVIFTHQDDIEIHLKQWCAIANHFIHSESSNRSEFIGIVAELIIDFWNIHPFIDFNGKLSRILLAVILRNEDLIRIQNIVGRRAYYAAAYVGGRGWSGPLESAIKYVLTR